MKCGAKLFGAMRTLWVLVIQIATGREPRLCLPGWRIQCLQDLRRSNKLQALTGEHNGKFERRR